MVDGVEMMIGILLIDVIIDTVIITIGGAVPGLDLNLLYRLIETREGRGTIPLIVILDTKMIGTVFMGEIDIETMIVIVIITEGTAVGIHIADDGPHRPHHPHTIGLAMVTVVTHRETVIRDVADIPITERNHPGMRL